MDLTKKNVPKWVILLIDLFIVFFSIVLAFLLRFNFEIPENEYAWLYRAIVIIFGTRAISFIIFKTYTGIIRYTSTEDIIRLFLVLTIGSAIFIIGNLVSYYLVFQKNLIPYSIIIIEFLVVAIGITAYRVLIKVAFMELKNPSKDKTNVVIFGAGEAGIITKRTLDRDAGTKYKVIAFIDDDNKKIGKKIENVPIFPTDKLYEVLATNHVENLILSVQNLTSKRKKEIIDICLSKNTKVLNIPPVRTWINGELSFKQFKKVRIEDLLERDPIQLDKKKIKSTIKGKVVMITGAAGSIGSEIVRQVAEYNPKNIICLDQAETPLHELELELREHHASKSFEIVLCDVLNRSRMRVAFEKFHPQIIFHAAAYKHVPMMENNPMEAGLTNIKGSKIISDLAMEFKVEKFIMVSTDKAVNPTNVMGASKRIAEIYTQSLNGKNSTKFITTRFGNVLGSNGSVIPLFSRQIEEGGPITITHPKVTRYFMTIPEACQLVLEAGAMGNGGEIYIFDMGDSVKIVDLAKKMIKLSGLELGKDIQITYTGLRPGEKLFEELLATEENTISTHHPQIMIAKVREYELETVENALNELLELFKTQDNFTVVKKMKELVPEYKSQNSIYEQLD
jgi:FlaA1/EpsC-like NDP-sugar epimerase